MTNHLENVLFKFQSGFKKRYDTSHLSLFYLCYFTYVRKIT